MLALCLTIDWNLHRACNLVRLHAVLHREHLPQPLWAHHHQYVHQRGGGSCFSFSAERIMSEFWYLKEEIQSDWVLLITSKPTQNFTTYLFNFLLSGGGAPPIICCPPLVAPSDKTMLVINLINLSTSLLDLHNCYFSLSLLPYFSSNLYLTAY